MLSLSLSADVSFRFFRSMDGFGENASFIRGNYVLVLLGVNVSFFE